MSKYKPYPKYKKSGVEWLGDVPEGWSLPKLSLLTSHIGDGLHGTPKYIEKSIFYFINGNNLINGEIKFKETTKYISEEEYIRHKKPLNLKTLLLSINGTIGNMAFYNNENIMLGKSSAYINCTDKLLRKYLYYFLKSSSINQYFSLNLTGTTILNLSLETIRNTIIAFPPLKEQKQISTYLDQKTQKIDTLIKKQQTLIKLLKEKRQALISHAVTKGLDDSVDMKDSGVEWLGDVPKRWEQRKLKFFARIKNGQDQKKVITDNGQYPIYGSGGEFGRANNYLYNKVSVLLGRKGTVDKPLFITEPFWTVDTMYFTKINNYTNPRFFYYSCLTIPFTYYQYGSALPSMTQENLHNHHFIAPPLKEQKEIAHYLDQKTQKIDTLITKSTQAIELLKERRTALISAVVTGKVDVREDKNV